MIQQRTLTGSNTSTLRSHNLRAILHALLRHEGVSRARLAELTGLSTTAVTNLIGDLLAQGLVSEQGAVQPKRGRGVGRPRVALTLEPQARYAVGVHIGVGNVRVGVSDLLARPVSYVSHAHDLDQPPDVVFEDILTLIGQAIADSQIDVSQLVGLGIGASGLVDPQTGVNLVAPNLGWQDVPIQDWFSQRVDLPVCVDNNVRAMALGEAMFGAGRDAHVLAFVYARIGVGAGFVVNGQLYRGFGAGAGEIGHVTMIPQGGELCRCGNSGCLETLVSEPAMLQAAEALARQNPAGLLAVHLQNDPEQPLEQVFAAARAGDTATQAMLAERAGYMAIALANVVNILNPELIILGGIFEQGHDLLLPAIETTLRERAFFDLGRRVRLCLTSFGRQAGVVGAASLALNAFFYQQDASA